VLKKRAAEVDVDHCGPGEEDAFYVADMGVVPMTADRTKMVQTIIVFSEGAYFSSRYTRSRCCRFKNSLLSLYFLLNLC
jgi:hypothetical protein